jgi:acetyl esterase/lipase
MRIAVVLLLLTATACDRPRDHPSRRREPPDPSTSHERILDRTYLTLAGRDLRLDVYVPRARQGTVPTVLYLHGGGWIGGTKEQARPDLVPYLAAGWAVVNPDYRLAPGDLAPAAIEDAVCALRWLAAHAGEYGFDLRRVVVAGYSAGAHLALMLGLLPDSASFGVNCPGMPTPHAAAVVNVAGITDVRELLLGRTRRDWAVTWVGDRPDPEHLVASVSPLTWVRAGVPPIITVHGEADSVVPYGQAVRLHRALDRVGVANQLVTLRRNGHWALRGQEGRRAMAAVMAFLGRQGLTPIRTVDRPPVR